MPRFKRESWVRKMQDDYSDAYPVRSDLHPEPPMIATSGDYGSDWDKLKAKQNNETTPELPPVNAADYRWRKMGKLPNMRSRPQQPFTPYISPIGYSRHFPSYQNSEIQTPRNQKYTVLTMPNATIDGNGMEMRQPEFISMRSARQYRNLDSEYELYANRSVASKSVPYRGRFDPSGGYLANLQSMHLHPQSMQPQIDPVTGLLAKGVIEEFLDTTYREPWRNPNARMY